MGPRLWQRCTQKPTTTTTTVSSFSQLKWPILFAAHPPCVFWNRILPERPELIQALPPRVAQGHHFHHSGRDSQMGMGPNNWAGSYGCSSPQRWSTRVYLSWKMMGNMMENGCSSPQNMGVHRFWSSAYDHHARCTAPPLYRAPQGLVPWSNRWCSSTSIDHSTPLFSQ